jgi:predicted transcriptional regulator
MIEEEGQIHLETKRSKSQILIDILSAINNKSGRIKKTHIMYTANMTHTRLEQYLETLMSNEFITINHVKNQNYYSLTKKGEEFLNEIRKLNKMSKSFGLPI